MALGYDEMIRLSTLYLIWASVLFKETSHMREFPENLKILFPRPEFLVLRFRVSGQFGPNRGV